jgi:hemerythrin-like domain-containing protein
MKRHPVLQDLSRDHFFALEQGQRLRRAQADTLATAVDEFLRFWRGKMVHHFREEEEVLIPMLARHRPADDPAVVTVLVQHVDIARHAIDLESSRRDVPVAHSLGELIDRHVRHEESVLFPMIEVVLSEDELTDLGARLIAFDRAEGTDPAV